MSSNKRLIAAGAAAGGAGAFDPLQNFETVTYTGNGSTQKITGYIRKGAAFNGSSSRISLPSTINTTYVTPTGSFSAATWVNFNTVGTAEQQIICFNTAANLELSLNTNSNTGKIVMRIYKSGASPENVYLVSTTTVSANTWYHVAITYNNGSWALYINGSSEDTGTQTLTQPTTNIFLGERLNNSQYLNGKIDQVRIFNTALDSTQVGELALETYADPKKSTTDYFDDGHGVALYELDEDALSSNFEQAAVFNGSSSKIEIPATSITPLDFSTENWTISLWFNANTFSQYDGIFSKWSTSETNRSFRLNLPGSSPYNKIEFVERIPSSTNSTYTSTVSLNAGQWYHIAITRSASELKIYINGSAETFSATNNIRSGGTDPIVLGFLPDTSGYFDGKIDQVRIYSSVLSSTDVEKLYEESADVPTTNLVAHYKLDGNAEDVLDTYDGTETSITYSAGVYGGTPTNVNFLGMAFQPDLVWTKTRSQPFNHSIYDSVRGVNKLLQSNTTIAEFPATNALNSFDSNGFTLGANDNSNTNGESSVAWCWRAAGAANTYNVLEGGTVTSDSTASGAGITAGTITTGWEVSANRDAGFSIVKYTKSGTSGTMGHGLSSAPEIIFEKRTDGAAYWNVRVNGITANNQTIYLNESTGVSTHPSLNLWTTPTASVFGYDSANATAGDYIAYCFHSVDGYQKVGSYLGNTSTLPSVDLGFSPRFVMIKEATDTGSWLIYDSVRPSDPVTQNDKILFANDSPAESTSAGNVLNFTSTGFDIEAGSSELNTNGNTYIYLAIA